jgi:5-methylcytosine-specific restriction endonuclease McrA
VGNRVREALRLRSGRDGDAAAIGYKNESWQTAFGYTKQDLCRHIERQFTRGMTWQNFGTFWHLDHIVPLASFSYTGFDDPEFKAAWALTNLRPLEKIKNIQKHAKRTHLL